MFFARPSVISTKLANKIATAKKSLLLPLLMIIALVGVVFSGSAVHSSGSFTEEGKRNGDSINPQDESGLKGTNTAHAASGQLASPTASTARNNFVSLSTGNESAATEGGERADLNHSSVAAKFFPSMVAAMLTATKVDAVTDTVADGGNNDGNLDPGEKVTYTVTITNSGSDATHVKFSDTIDDFTTLVGVAPVAMADHYDAIGNTLLEVGVAASGNPAVRVTTAANDSVLDNDFETSGDTFTLKAPFPTTSANGGTVSMNSSGNFTYTPPVGFTGNDTFTYTITDDGADNIAGNADDLTNTGTVTINVTQRVWYVKNNSAAGGLGRSGDPFDTLAEAQAQATVDGDTIYVFNGNNTNSGQNSGITLQANNQRLIGEGVQLDVPVSVNGGPNPTVLRNFGTAANIGNSGGNGVAVTNFSGIVIRGLNIGGSTNAIAVTMSAAGGGVTISNNTITGGTGNAIDVTTSGVNGGGSATISSNTISGAGAEGIDINAGGTGAGTLIADVQSNALTATGNAFDARTTAGALVLNFSNNPGIISGANGVDISGAGGGTLTITGFANDTVSGNTAGTGILITTARFDATPGGNLDAITAGTTTIGAPGNGVGVNGLVLSGTTGNLPFTDLDIVADGGTGLSVAGTGLLTATTGTGISVGASVGTIAATGGPAVNVTAATIDLQLTSITSTYVGANAGNGVSLTSNVAGTFSAGSGSSITNAGGDDFVVGSGTANITYNAAISSNSGHSVNVASHSGGTVAFTGTIGDTGTGISLTNNTGATINFTGQLTLSTGGNAAFTATGGGTVSSSATTSTIATTTGEALRVTSTTIGSNGLKFQSISAGTAASGPTNAIILNTTGNAGGLSVLGTGSAGTGGTIQKTDQGALFTSTSSLTLKYMNFTNANMGDGGSNCTNVDDSTFNSGCKAAINMNGVTTATLDGLSLTNPSGTGGEEVGINGISVSTLSILNSTVSGFGDEVNEADMKLFNLTGTCAITNSTFSFPSERGAAIRNNTGTLNLSVTNSTFSENQTAISADGLEISDLFAGAEPVSPTMTVNVTGSTFLKNRTNGLQTRALNNSYMSVNVTTSSFDWGSGNGVNDVGKSIEMDAEDTSKLEFNIYNNPLLRTKDSTALIIFGIDSAVIDGWITNNQNIDLTGTGGGIWLNDNDNAVMKAGIINNKIFNIRNRQIGIYASTDAGPGVGTAKLDATITGNDVTLINAANPNQGLFGIKAQAGGGDPNTNVEVCVDVGGSTAALGNDITGVNYPAVNAAYTTRVANTGDKLYLEGFNTSPTNTWNIRNNTPSGAVFEDTAPGATPPSAPPGGAPYNGVCRSPSNTQLTMLTPGANPREVLAQSASPFVGDTGLASEHNVAQSIGTSPATILLDSLLLASEDAAHRIPNTNGINGMLASQASDLNLKLWKPVKAADAAPVENIAASSAAATRQEAAISSAETSAAVAVAEPAASTTWATAVAGPSSVMTVPTLLNHTEQATRREDSNDQIALASADSKPVAADASRPGKNRNTVMMSHAVMTRSRNRALAAAALVGPTFTVDGDTYVTPANSGFTLPAGQSVVIKFQVKLNDPPGLDATHLSGGPHIRNQGTVTADGPITVQTDDPALGGGSDPTDTPVDLYDSQTTVTTNKPGGIIEGESVTFEATVIPNQVGSPSTLGGTVDFFDGPVPPGSSPIAGCQGMTLSGSPAKATCTTTALTSAGSPHTITARYNGNGNFDTSTGTVSQTVNPCISNPVVNSTADPGDGVCDLAQCTLREAIQSACVGASITFDIGNAAPDTILLGSTLVISKNLSISNPNSSTKGAVTISANNGNFGVFRIDSPASTVNISDLTVTGVNATSISGGGLLAQSGTVTLTGMLFTGNTVINGDGGGVTAGSSSTVNIRNSTISGNTARHGGGLFSSGGTFNLLNVTVTNNNANGNTGTGACPAGGSVNGAGGGIETGGNTTNVKNSILAGNTACDAGALNTSGTFINVSNNIVSGDPLIAPTLANNGGPTQTHALLIGSPALDAGDNCVFDGTCAAPYNGVTLTTDQRGTGFTRKADSADAGTTQTVDIGALEAQPTISDIPDKPDGLEDASIASYPFNVGDAAIGIDSITTSVTSDPSGVVQSVTVNNATTATPDLSIAYVADKFGTATIQVTVNKTINGQLLSMSDSFVLTVSPVAETPVVPAGTTTNEDIQTSAIVITPGAADGPEVTHFKITGITNGNLFQADGSTPINNGDFITVAQGSAGLKFTPSANLFSPSTTFSFQVQGATSATGNGLGNAATVPITVNPIADTPSVGNTTTNEDTQTAAGQLVINRNGADSTEVTHFKITGITGGTLFQTDGTTQINNNDFITFAQGNAGLRFTPNSNLFSPSTTFSFTVQASIGNTDGGLGGSTVTATITVNPVADTPVVPAGTTTNEDTQTSAIVLARNAADGAEVTHFKITNITNGTLFQSDGSTPIANNGFITFAQGNSGVKFTPSSNLFSPSSTFSFDVQGATDASGGGLGTAATVTITVNTVADTPSVTPATTDEDTQTTSGLVISRNAADNTEVTHFKITNITGGTLFQNDGTTPINNGDFITFAQGNAGLKFTPSPNLVVGCSFKVQASLNNTDAGLGGSQVTATITINPIADTPSVTPATTAINTQTTTGLVITKNANDGAEVTHFKITSITNGTLFKNDGTTPINNNDFITAAEGGLGLKFTPDLNKSTTNGDTFSFKIQGATDASGSGLTPLADAATATITVQCQSGLIVDTTGDAGVGETLRHAISFSCPDSTVTFNIAGAGPHTITLTAGQIIINKNLTITGPTDGVIVSGGGSSRIFNITSGNVNISNLTITGGQANTGGGISHEGGTLTIGNSTFTGNNAVGGSGEGGAIYSKAGTLNLVNTTISGNAAETSGGGLLNRDTSTATLINVTITNNRADSDNSGSGKGGGIGQASNQAITLHNTIVAGNFNEDGATDAPDDIFVDPGPPSAINPPSSHNLIGVDTGVSDISNGDANGNQIGTALTPLDARLGALANNGGPVQTHALLPGSPALDKGDNSKLPADTLDLDGDANVAETLPVDQRGTGFARIADGPDDPDTTDTTDVGAFEAHASIQDIADQSISEDPASPLSIVFNIGDADLITAVGASSGNATLVPNDVAHIKVDPGPTTSQRTLVINPATNQFGTSTITVTVTSGTESMSDTFLLTVGTVPDTPSVTNATTNEDTQTAAGQLVISRNAADSTEVTHFKITGITNGTLFKSDGSTQINNNDFITFAEGNAGLRFTPALNSFVAGSFSVQASTDAVGTVLSAGSALATITVNAVADTPSVTNATTNEDTQTAAGQLVISRNAADSTEVTHFKITGITNGTLFKSDGSTQINNNDFITFAEGNAGLKFTPAANLFSPSSAFSFQVQGATSAAGAGLSIGFATATITVNTVADTPSVTNATTNEDTQTTTGLVISRNAADGAEVTNFKITNITGGTLFQNNGTTPINNGDFITIAQGAAGLKFTPTANSNVNGSFQIQSSLSAVDAGLGGNLATATITVNPVNDAPTLDAIGNLTINEDAPLQTVNLTGIAAGGGESQTLIVTATSDNTGLIPNPTVNYISPNATGTLTFTPVADQSGSALVTVTVNDGGGTANGGVETVVRTFTVTVNAVNDAPVNNVPGSQTANEDIPLTFSAANTNLISITDVDAGAAVVQATLTATNGTLTLSSTTGLAFTVGDGTADATMTFSGTLAGINAALNGLVFTPTAGFHGAASIQITTDDQGNTGAGGALTDTDIISITVNERSLQFSSDHYTVGEADGHATITVTRTGGTTLPASVQFTTSDLSGLTNCDVVTGNASARCDYTAVGGTLNFAAGTSSLTFTVPVINDVYVEGPEVLTLTLSNPTGGILGTPSTATLTITDTDDVAPGAPNPIDIHFFFIRQHYLDFLNREPEPQGLADWLNILDNCPAGDIHCDEIEVSSDFFRSPEFFERSYFVYRFYEVAFGRHPLYDEYQRDIRRVCGFLNDAEKEARKQEFIAEFMSRQEFRDRYDQIHDAIGYVSALEQTAGVHVSNESQLVNDLAFGQKTRGDVLRAIVESPEASQKFYNKAFVVVGYFAYLRRDPDIAYLVWLDKLNTTGDYREMIHGFLHSPEYRSRFGLP